MTGLPEPQRATQAVGYPQHRFDVEAVSENVGDDLGGLMISLSKLTETEDLGRS